MTNIYAQHEARRARFAPALEGTDRNNRITGEELLDRLGEPYGVTAWGSLTGEAATELTNFAATGAIGGSWSSGFFQAVRRENGRS